MDKTPTPLTDALLQWEGRSTQDKGYRSMVGHARRLERRCAALETMMQEAVNGFGRILISTSDDKAVRDWQKRARALLENKHG